MQQSRFRSLVLSLPIAIAAEASHAQLENPVYVDDSPQARELFLRAQDQIRDNAGEAVRLLQELLDEYGSRLLPINQSSEDHFVAVRQRVIEEIATNPALLERYRLVETAEAQRLMDAGDLQRLAMTRSLTEPGLEAMMRVAQDAMETARFHVALHWLDDINGHPLRTQRHEMYAQMMRGIAARGIGDTELVRQSIEALSRLAGPEAEACRRQVEAMAAASIPAPSSGVSPLDRAHVSDLQTLVSQPIWRTTLDSGDREDQPQIPDELDPALSELVQQREGRFEAATTTATVGHSAVYVTTPNAVFALDRYTGRPAWDQPFSLSPVMGGSFGSDGMGLFGLNVCALGSQSLVALSSDPRLRDGRVACLDPETGRERWSRSITEIAGRDDTENIMPHGAPVIAEGLVFIMARKVTRQLLTSCYVVAMDIDTGEIRWSRHIASVGGTFNRDMRPLTTVVYDRGDLYVDSSVGAVARIDAATGQTRWLRRFTSPITAIGRGRAAFELGSAVVTPRGVLALQSDLNRVVLLDRDTGFDVEWHDASTAGGWGSPRYLLAGGEFVYAIGRDIRAFHLDNLGEPIWRLPESTPQGRLRSGLGDRSVDIRGRVQLVDGSLIVPTADGMMIIEDVSGVIQHELAMDLVGNPVAVGSQLVVTGPNDVASYMPFDRAEEILRQRIASEPTEARPALALLEMSIRARNLPLVLEAADLARMAIGETPDTDSALASQRELFTLLLEADRQRLASTVDEGESLHAIIGYVASGPSQRVEHLLAKGDWLSERDLGRAVECYHAILSDPGLAATPREEGLIVRAAADAATGRLGALIQKHGESVYSTLAHEATQTLQGLRGQASSGMNLGSRVDRLLALARTFPLSDAATQATIAAAEQLASHDSNGTGLGTTVGGQPDGGTRSQRTRDTLMAVDALIDSYRAYPNRTRAASLLGRAAEACTKQGWHDLASGIIAHSRSQYPGIQLEATESRIEDSTSTRPHVGGSHREANSRPDVDLTASRRDGRSGRSDNSSIGAILDEPAESRSGRIVPWYGSSGVRFHRPHDSENRDSMLLIDDHTLRLIAAPDLEERWSVEIADADPRLLLMDGERVFLWLGGNADDLHAIMLSAKDGRQLWPGPSLRFNDAIGGGPDAGARSQDAASLPQGANLGRVDVQTPDGRLINRNEVVPLVDRERLVMVRRTGDVVALDLDTGQTKLWSKTQLMDQVHLVRLTDWALVLAGTRGSALRADSADGSEGRAPEPTHSGMHTASCGYGILALDPATGEVLSSLSPSGGEPVVWMELTALGELLIGTPGSVELIDLMGSMARVDGEREKAPARIWTNAGHYAQSTRGAWVDPSACVIEDRNRMVRSIDLASGRISDPFDVGGSAAGRGVHGAGAEGAVAGDAADLVDVQITPDAVATLYTQRVVLTDHQGALIGSDVIAEEREYKALYPVKDGWVLISRFRSAQDVLADDRSRRTRHTYMLYNLSRNGALIGEPYKLEPIAQRLQAVDSIDDWLILSFEDSCVAIRAPR